MNAQTFAQLILLWIAFVLIAVGLAGAPNAPDQLQDARPIMNTQQAHTVRKSAECRGSPLAVLECWQAD